MRPYILRPRAAIQQTGPPPAVLRTGFNYKAVWQDAHIREEFEAQREADEDPDDLQSEPANDCDEDDLPDFDPPSSPLCTPPTSPSLDAIIDSEDNIPNLVDVNDGEELTLEEIKSLFGDNIIKPTPFADVQPADAHFATPIPSPSSTPSPRSSPPSDASSEFDPSPHEGALTIPSKRRSPSAKAANRARKDRKKNEETADRRSSGQLPVHGEAYVNRHTQSQFVSRDFSVLDYSAVSGGGYWQGWRIEEEAVSEGFDVEGCCAG